MLPIANEPNINNNYNSNKNKNKNNDNDNNKKIHKQWTRWPSDEKGKPKRNYKNVSFQAK